MNMKIQKVDYGRAMEIIVTYLGRKPESRYEYNKLWEFLFRGSIEEKRKRLIVQKRRHNNHSFNNVSSKRKYCVFCVREGRM